MKKILSILILGIVSAFVLTSCVTNSDFEALKKENAELKEKLAQSSNLATEKPSKPNNKYNAVWVEDGTPYLIESGTGKMEVLDNIQIVKDSDCYLLLLNFNYTNNSDNAMNFINDSYLSVQPYQNGIELEHPGIVSKKGLYDMSNAYKSIKQGATIKAQLAFELQDITSPIDVELGHYSDYNKKIIKTINIIE